VTKLQAPTKEPQTVTAIHANKGTEAWYRDKLDQILSAMHTDLVGVLQRTWTEAPPTIGYAADNGVTFTCADAVVTIVIAMDAPSSTLRLQKALEKWGRQWEKRFDKLSLDLSARFAAKNFRNTELSMKHAFANSGFTVEFKPTRKSVESYRAVAAENVNLIKSIPQQYLADVQTQVWQSVAKGSDLHTLSQGLRKTYGVSTRRAALIARDQNNKAKAVIENTRRQELGITHAYWQHSRGGKVPRPEHVAFDGHIYELKKGAFLEGKRVWPGSEINCRCTSRSIIPGFGK
jgi:SPP1 gp7 family putative phage head morphogenesis protein